MPSRALLDRASEAYGLGIEQHDWEPLRRLYHPSALIDTPLRPGIFIPPPVFFENEDALHRTFIAGPRELVPIDENAGLVVGRLRSRNGDGFRTVERVWLLTFADGLIYRQRSLTSAAEARALYEEHGHDLGMRGPDA